MESEEKDTYKIYECCVCGSQYTKQEVIDLMSEDFLGKPFICKDCYSVYMGKNEEEGC